MIFCRLSLTFSNITRRYVLFKSEIYRSSSRKCCQRLFSSANTYSNNPRIAKCVDLLLQEYKELLGKNDVEKFRDRLAELRPFADIHEQKLIVLESISSLDELTSGNSKDADLLKQIEGEKLEYLRKIEKLDQQLLDNLIPHDDYDTHHKTIMEINAGVGGQEAMLFAKELFDMYCSYFAFKGWDLDSFDSGNSDVGGLRHATLFVTGDESYKYLKHEAGVHRVQRIPATEKSGRIHTSTVSITVLPQPQEIGVKILDKDLRIETKRASGAGGQHVNKTESAVRMTHLPTGISVECQTDRSQIRNRAEALRKLQAILIKKQIEEQITSTNSARKMQVKSNLRSEKLRTYNFNQDRITDHRISRNCHNLPDFFTGSEQLDSLLKELEENYKQELLFQKVEEICGKS